MRIAENLKEEYEAEQVELVINDRRFRFFVPANLEKFFDPEDLFQSFPLWSKIWESSLVLADHLARQTPDAGKRIIEIGCGLGVSGIVASAFGHRVVVTEYNPDALHFVRANALLNECSDIEIRELDWNSPRLEEKFDLVMGSEVIYKEENFDLLLNLFRTLLKADGEVVLTAGIRKTSVAFFRQMQDHFEIVARKKTIRSGTEEFTLMLCTMKWKKDAPAMSAQGDP
jgi:predicted nicotinamide N-methyase